MKNLVEYIKEAQAINVENLDEEKKESKATSKTFKLNFGSLENADETINSLKEMGKEGVSISVDDKSVEITVSDANAASKIFEMLQEFASARRKDQKVASSEPYAECVAKFEKVVSSYFDWVDELAAEENSAEEE